MYLDKEGLKNASIEDILKELEVVYEELFCVARSFPSSRCYALWVYRDMLFKELQRRI